MTRAIDYTNIRYTGELLATLFSDRFLFISVPEHAKLAARYQELRPAILAAIEFERSPSTDLYRLYHDMLELLRQFPDRAFKDPKLRIWYNRVLLDRNF